MSDGERGRHDSRVGIAWWGALIVFPLVFLWWGYLDHQSDRYRHESERAKNIAYELCSSVEVAAERGACVSDTLTAFQRENYAQKDVVAQEQMAVYALAAFVIGALGVFLIWRTLMETGEVLNEARKATDAANRTVDATQRIGEAQVRAYLTCIGGEFFAKDDTLTVLPIFKNLGQSPAKNVIVHFSMDSVVPEGLGDIGENMHRLWFDETEKRPTQIDDIAPSESENGRFAFKIAVDGLSYFDMVWAPLQSGLVMLIATGYVTWDDVFDKPNHQAFWLRFSTNKESTDSFSGKLSRKE